MTAIGVVVGLVILTGLFVTAGGNEPQTATYYGGKQFQNHSERAGAGGCGADSCAQLADEQPLRL
jgi:hypothetical protein